MAGKAEEAVGRGDQDAVLVLDQGAATRRGDPGGQVDRPPRRDAPPVEALAGGLARQDEGVAAHPGDVALGLGLDAGLGGDLAGDEGLGQQLGGAGHAEPPVAVVAKVRALRPGQGQQRLAVRRPAPGQLGEVAGRAGPDLAAGRQVDQRQAASAIGIGGRRWLVGRENEALFFADDGRRRAIRRHRQGGEGAARQGAHLPGSRREGEKLVRLKLGIEGLEAA
ncbi:hypothetical protein [Caulobacter sp. UC70_42]|uniref:hypothetical protein n=1 Tax=Caulobacter sp. UC70_42 TaxID=3374551 RepID=UPI00375737C0